MQQNKIKIGSLFSGIGGFELGLERAIPRSKTIWQVEQDSFCQKVLKKHWPQSILFDDIGSVGAHNLEPVDIICGGFPCQDISTAGKRKGINGKKSGLWFEMLRVISELRPRVAILENVPVITVRGISRVLGGLAQIGYDSEWTIVSALQFGAPHLRKRWFCVAYPNSSKLRIQSNRESKCCSEIFTAEHGKERNDRWEQRPPQSSICGMDDGVSRRLDKDRLRALGNAIVPQCSEFIGRSVFKSGVLNDLL
jgi:DNA (cytosine-5)-methyltransferase 1